MYNSHWTFSLHLSSSAESGIEGFSALHVKYLPSSSIDGVKDNRLNVWLLASENWKATKTKIDQCRKHNHHISLISNGPGRRRFGFLFGDGKTCGPPAKFDLSSSRAGRFGVCVFRIVDWLEEAHIFGYPFYLPAALPPWHDGFGTGAWGPALDFVPLVGRYLLLFCEDRHGYWFYWKL